MPEMKTLNGYEIVDAKAREDIGGCVKSSDKNSGNYVYTRLSGVDSVTARKSVSNDTTSLTGCIPQYVYTNQLTTGTPTTDYSCVNLKYFNENKGDGGTKLYKHTINGGRFIFKKYNPETNTNEITGFQNLLPDEFIEILTTSEPPSDLTLVDFLNILRNGILQIYIDTQNEIVVNGTMKATPTYSIYYVRNTKYQEVPPFAEILWFNNIDFDSEYFDGSVPGGTYTVDEL